MRRRLIPPRGLGPGPEGRAGRAGLFRFLRRTGRELERARNSSYGSRIRSSGPVGWSAAMATPPRRCDAAPDGCCHRRRQSTGTPTCAGWTPRGPRPGRAERQTGAMTELTLPYFVAIPGNPTGRGVVVAHEGLGLATQILRFAERLAAEGFLVIAPTSSSVLVGHTTRTGGRRSTRSPTRSCATTWAPRSELSTRWRDVDRGDGVLPGRADLVPGGQVG